MLLVIYSHICLLGIHSTPPPRLSYINNIFLIFRMPLFFFISGFFVYSSTYTSGLLKQRSKNRLLRQLYPTLLIGAIFCTFFYDANFIGMWYNQNKGGYWFTIVAVEMFFTIAPLLYYLNIKKTRTIRCIAILAILGILSRMLSLVISKFAIDWPSLSFFSAFQYFHYLIFFLGGIIFRMIYPRIYAKINSIRTLLTAAICFTAFLCIQGNPIISLLTSCAGIILVIALYSILYTRTTFSGTRTARLLEVIGKSTLEIYLIHYFIIEILKYEHLRSVIEHICGMWLEFPVYFTISILIAITCIGIAKALHLFNISNFIFPTIKNNKQPAHAS